MGLLNSLRARLLDPRVAGVDLDSTERLRAHREILADKPTLLEVYRELYDKTRALDEHFLRGSGMRIELGSGTSLLRRYYPDVLRSDVVQDGSMDMTLDATHMDLPDRSVRAFYMINTFHHFSRPTLFFSELERTLVAGGGAVFIEPYFGPTAQFLFKRIFDSEGFDARQPTWELATSSTAGPMTQANQALSYIVFCRDRPEFERQNPTLRVVHRERLNNYLRYLASGGINYRQIIPSVVVPGLRLIEQGLRPISHLFALHYALVLRKT